MAYLAKTKVPGNLTSSLEKLLAFNLILIFSQIDIRFKPCSHSTIPVLIRVYTGFIPWRIRPHRVRPHELILNFLFRVRQPPSMD